jgi:hypothetical protein
MRIKIKIYIQRITILTIGATVFLNFMFLSDNRLKHQGLGPIVQFQVNSNFAGLGLQNNVALTTIQKAAMQWFSAGESTFAFSLKGKQTGNSPTSFDSIECSANAAQILPDNPVFSQDNADADCSSESCTFVWSCDGFKNPRAVSIQFNTHDFSFQSANSVDNRINLEAIALHSFGHAAGLSHCQIGETPTQCEAQTINGQTNPGIESVMSSIPEAKLRLSTDDIAGLQALYGVQKIPFPESSTITSYGLSVRETQDVITYQQNLALPPAGEGWRSPANLRERAADLVIVYRAVRRTPESLDAEADNWAEERTAPPPPTNAEIDLILTQKGQVMEQYYAVVLDSIPTFIDSDLEGVRSHTSSALFSHAILKPYLDLQAGECIGIVNRNFELMLSLRKAVIDEQVKRGIYE